MRKLLTLWIALAAVRRLLLAFGLCLWAQCAWAVQAIDGTPQGNSASAVTIVSAPAFSTTGTNRIIRACVFTAQLSATGAAATVTSITDTNSLTWTLRGKKNGQMTGITGTPWLDLECWDAIAAATQTNNIITANLSASADDSGIIVFAISGNNTTLATLYDTGGSTFPLSGQDLSGTTTPSISSVSTGCDKTMIVMAAYSGTTGALPADQTAGAGFTLILNFAASAGTNNSKGATQQKVVAATQSGVTTAFGTAWFGWFALTDAFRDATATCSGAAAGPPRGSLMMMGVGR